VVTRRPALAPSSFADFGSLRMLRRRARLTQRDLGIAVGYSEAQISRLEQHKRLPDPAVVAALFLPALQATLGDLSEPSRRLIRMIAVFRHPVDLLDGRLIEASEALWGGYDVLAGLDELRRRQLVDHPARADLHPLVCDHIYAGFIGAASGRKQLHHLAALHCERVLDDPLEASWHHARGGDAAEAADLLAARAGDLTATGRSGRAADLAGELLTAGNLTADAERQLRPVAGMAPSLSFLKVPDGKR